MGKHALSALALCLGLGAASAAAAADDTAAALIALEKQSWVAWQGHDGAFFERFLSADHVEVGVEGPYGKRTVVAGVAEGGCTVRSYEVDAFKVTRLTPDAAVVTYRASQDTLCGGARVPSPVWATSVYIRRDGRWQNAVYQHSPASPPAKPAGT